MNCDFPLTKATVALGSTDGQFACLVRELVFPPGKSAAEIKEMFVNDLAAAKIGTVVEQAQPTAVVHLRKAGVTSVLVVAT